MKIKLKIPCGFKCGAALQVEADAPAQRTQVDGLIQAAGWAMIQSATHTCPVCPACFPKLNEWERKNRGRLVGFGLPLSNN